MQVSPSTIRVSIDGCVRKPGHFEMEKGKRIADLLALAGAKREANLEVFSYRARLKDGQHIHVPEYEFITVEVKGAIQTPGLHRVPLGCRPRDLPKWLPLTTNADLARLSRKRKRAKEGACIEIPFKC